MMRFLSAAIALACIASARSQEPATFTFRSGLRSVSELMDSGRWAEASTRLHESLQEPDIRDEARYARSEIEMLDRRCRFHGSYVAPEPQRLTSGNLKRFSKDGSIDVRYSPANLDGDFSTLEKPAKKKSKFDKLLRTMRSAGNSQATPVFHDASFSNYTVELSGKSYSLVRFYVAVDAAHFYDVVVGTSPRGFVYYPVTITKVGGDGSRKELFAERWGADAKSKRKRAKKCPIRDGEPFKIKLGISSTQIRLSFNGRTIATARKSPKDRGRFGVAARTFDQLKITGKCDPAWIQARRDAHEQTEFAAFSKSYDARSHLPGWLFEAPAKPKGKPAATDKKPYPGEQAPGNPEFVQELVKQLNEGSYRTVLMRLTFSTDRDLTPVIREYFRAVAWRRLEEYDKALESCEKVCAGDPEFAPTRTMRAALYSELGRNADAEFEAALELDPTEVDTYIEYTHHLLVSRRLDDAQNLLDRAKAKVEFDDQLEKFERLLLKLRNGPGWTRSFKVETANFVIESNIDQRVCREAGRILETALKYYQRKLGELPPSDGRRFQVYVFSGRASFDAYCKDVVGRVRVHTAGLYSPFLKQLLIWNQPDRNATLRTIRHEGFHQYFDALTDEAPSWLNEGLAEYFEVSRTRTGAPGDGLRRPRHLATLKRLRRATVPFEQLIRIGHSEFYLKGAVNYAQSWAWVHFLRKHRKYKSILQTILDGLREKKRYRDVRKLALDGIDVEKLNDDFWAHVESLSK